ncbi:hypothetical protein K491DRAFT_708629 [Lophiostoma macrostomum CBS 122681]|uniref:Uncharacterized protein n=1 Tax=Lophiostoma macrostomum CBS 122681 TaxID=1314788 RepID=A0A6A6SNM5_9PLEO|nr:hypothetical protein K491DRAFT_708629 [Lophiostoma macrostomum CBS 122681]
MTLNTSAVRDSEPWTASNETKQVIASLQLAQIQTLRTMHLTLGAFSLALALLTIHRIISDARRVAAIQVPLRNKRFAFLQGVHTAETFPLVLACGAVIQQIVFVAVQSTSLNSFFARGCRGLAMITYPVIFLLGYITLAFGIEMAIRSMKFERFAPRGKWNASMCLGIIGFLTLLTWIPTVVFPMYNFCFGSLIWVADRYKLGSIVLLSVLVLSSLLLAAIISIQLMRTSDVDPNERISASRMCYYLLIVALLYALVIPVEIQSFRMKFKSSLATSRTAEVALFTSGIFIAFFHLFLRVNATRMVIRPIKEGPSTKQKRPKIRFFGPSDLEMNISGPLALQGGRRPDSRQGLIDVGPEKNRYDFDPEYFVRPERPLTPGSMRSVGPVDPSKWPLPPDPVQTSITNEPKDGTEGLHKRNKSSYSLFPTRAEDIPRLPATVYSPPKSNNESRFSKLALRRQTRRSSIGDAKSVTDVTECFNFLSKPPPLFAGRHGRGESTDSSATVQIGLRFSVAPATLAAAKYTSATRQMDSSAPALRRDNSDTSAASLELPIQSPSTASLSSSYGDAASSIAFPEPPKATASPTQQGRVSPVSTDGAAYLQTQRDKVLPPTPRSTLPGPPPSTRPPPPHAPTHGMSGLRMNPISPSTPAMPASPPRSASSTRSPTARSPTARIPLGAGTMARSPPHNGWI